MAKGLVALYSPWPTPNVSNREDQASTGGYTWHKPIVVLVYAGAKATLTYDT